jgi:Fic family protein
VYEDSLSAAETARKILKLREEHRQLVSTEITTSANALKLLDAMFRTPVFSVKDAKEAMSCAFGTANTIIAKLEELGLLREITGQERNRRYEYEPYVRLFNAMDQPGASGPT